MGNARSRYDETDWDNATSATPLQTIDGAEPTPTHVKLTLTPQANVLARHVPVVNQLVPSMAEYEVRDTTLKTDNNNKILFRTVAVPKLEKGFDVVRVVHHDDDGETGETAVLRVDATASNRTWHIYQVDKPVFEEQQPDLKPSQATGDDLYRKACIVFGKGEQHAALVHMFTTTTNSSSKNDDEYDDEGDVETVLRVERCGSSVLGRPWQFQTMTQENGPLAGYFQWEGSPVPVVTKPERIVMDLAKGADVTLHVLLAVVATLERTSIKAEYSG